MTSVNAGEVQTMGIEGAALIMSQDAIDADRDGWLAARRGLVTASEIAAIAGVAPPEHGSPYSVWHEKVTGQSTVREVDAMRRGRALEPEIRAMLAQQRPELKLEPGGLYVSRARPWQGSTLDLVGWDTSADAELGPGVADCFPVEAKTAATEDGWDWRAGIVPVHYWVQVIWQLDTTGAQIALITPLFMLPWKLRVIVIRADDPRVQRDIALLRQAAVEHLGRVERQEPPPVDWTPATARVLRFMHPDLEDRAVRVPVSWARRYEAARVAEERAKQRRRLVLNQMAERMGTASAAVAVDPATGEEVKVVGRTKYDQGRQDLDALHRDWPDAYAATRRTGTVDKMYPGSWGQR